MWKSSRYHEDGVKFDFHTGGEDAEKYRREALATKKKLDAVVERYNAMKKKAKASLDEAKAEIASLTVSYTHLTLPTKA